MNQRQATTAIATRTPFKASALTGRPGFDGYGQMDRNLALGIEGADFVVYSYATPIAWSIGGSWIVPEVRYSVTTTRHQNLVRRATR